MKLKLESRLLGEISITSDMQMKVKVKSLSRVRLFETPWTVAYQAPLSIGFSRQEYWSGLPVPSPGDLLHPGIEPGAVSIYILTISARGFPLQHLLFVDYLMAILTSVK